MKKIKLKDYDKATKELLMTFGLEESTISRIVDTYESLEIKKGKSFLKEGKKSDKIGLLLSGLLYAYTTDDNGNKNVSRFFYSPENLIVVNLESFIQNKNSDETIECLEDSYLITIDREALFNLYIEEPQLNNIGRTLAEESYIKALKKIKLLQTKNGRERILLLREQSPELFLKVQKSYIASYLGMHRNTYDKAFKMIR